MTPGPLLKGCDGRDPTTGRFVRGWKGGPGNPLGAQTAKLRSALIKAVKVSDIREIARRLMEQAKSGDVRAIAELLNRVLGKPLEADILQRLEDLETRVEEVTR